MGFRVCEEVLAMAMVASGTITIALGIVGWTTITVLGLVVVVYGVVLAADSAPLSTAITQVAEDDNIGTLLAGQSLVGFLPVIVSPVVFGVVVDRSGFTSAFGTLFGGIVVGLGALWLFSRQFEVG